MDLLEHMRTFVDIVEHGSLAGVARARGRSPAAITGALQRLEEHVGATLVLRSTRSLALTAEGEQFLEDSRRLLEDAERAVERISDHGPLEGPIRISAINDVGRTRVAPLLDRFLADHPGVRVELALSDGVVDLIEDGFDLGLRTGPLADSRLTARLLLRSRRVVAAAPGYWNARGRPTHPSELVHHNCLVLDRPGHPQRTWPFLDGASPLQVTVAGDRSASAGDVLRRWAVAGAGVILKSAHDVVDDVRAGRLETVLEPYTRGAVNVYAVHAAGRRPSRRVAALIEYLAENLGG